MNALGSHRLALVITKSLQLTLLVRFGASQLNFLQTKNLLFQWISDLMPASQL